MPSLAETLQANKKKLLTRDASGNLVESTPGGVQELAQQQGMPAPPTTPLGAGLIGANPDQAKMMGTPAQKNAAISLASNPQQNLQTTLRQGQARTQATGAEAGKIEKSQALKDLGAMGDRVNDFINAQRTKLQTATPAEGGAGVQVKAADQFQGYTVADIENTKSLLDQWRQNPTDKNLILQVNKALGFDIDHQLDPSEVDALYQSATDAIAQGGAGVVSDKLTVADLVQNPAFQYDEEQLSSLLGVPVTEVSAMSVGDIQNKIAQIEQEEFANTAELEQKAQSGELGQAERGMARSLGREASATGIRASEADVSRLEDQIANADEVSFGGKAYKVDDLLRDDTISGIISDYMNSGEGSQTRADIDSKEPALSEFIKKNSAVLAQASQQLQQGAKGFQDIQAANKALANVGNIKLPDELMKAILPEWGELTSTQYSVDNSPVLSMLSGYTDHPELGDAAAAAQKLAQHTKEDPNFATQLAGLSTPELAALNPGKEGGLFDQFVNTKKDNEWLLNATPADIDAVINKKMGWPMGGMKKLQDTFTSGAVSNYLGFGDYPTSSLDSNKDGKLDSPEEMLANIKKGIQIPSLKDAAAGDLKGIKQESLSAPQLNEVQKSLVSKVGDKIKDGWLTPDELRNSNVSLDEALELSDPSKDRALDHNDLMNFIQTKKAEYTAPKIDEIGAGDMPVDEKIKQALGLVTSDPRHIDINTVEEKTRAWRKQALDQANAEYASDIFHQKESSDKEDKILQLATFPYTSAMSRADRDNIRAAMKNYGMTMRQLGTIPLNATVKIFKDFKYDPSKGIENIDALKNSAVKNLGSVITDLKSAAPSGAVKTIKSLYGGKQMANLLDTIRQTSGQISTQKQGVTDEAAQAQKLLRAKSGKASAGGPVASSNLGEQQAVAQTNETMQNVVAPAASLVTSATEQAASEVEQRAQEQQAEIAQATKFNGIQARIKTTSLLNDLAQRGGELDMKRDTATINQLATNLRLQSDKYVTNLELEGDRARLDDKNQFDEQYAKSVMGNNKSLLEKKLGNKSILAASDREYQKALAQMGIEDARAVMRQAGREAQRDVMTKMVGGILQQGAGMGGEALAKNNSSSSEAAPEATQSSSNYGTSDYGGGGEMA